MNLAKFLSEVKKPRVSELGGKGYSLVVLINKGFNVPRGFVITSLAFFEFLKYTVTMERIEKLASEINENNFQEKSKKARDLITSGEIPEEILSRIKESLHKLNAEHVSIRSSAVSEDSLRASFAGLHDTFLNVKSNPHIILEDIKKCWTSLFSERAVIYRIRKGIPHFEGMAIVIQEMVPVEISGITFTVHPTDKRSLLVEASYGIGDMVVSGKVEPDYYMVDRKTLEIVEKKIGRKNKMSIVEGEETRIVDVAKELAKKQVLCNTKVKEIAEICQRVEKIFNYAQDIEWCISKDTLWLLQSRAITGMRK